ncbi:spore cortex biosynthesis protein YabQ [Domibacillus mangrovi]|uniref:Spore cortex biosynthesis protein YabQ n=1 Tax=Domibacillus mangrovi TaxID=1714354 RepID=A0A1Q5P0R5_9BACI|nr:spore cortex biosynthesis protein YabQ [Domibacillus mangrovi]
MNLGTQIETALLMAVMGICFGMLLDVYRRIRCKNKKKTVLLILSDGLFWSIYAIGLFISLYYVNDGQVRLPFFLFLFVGVLLYFLSVRRFFLPLMHAVFFLCRLIRNIIKTIIHIFFINPVLIIMKTVVFLARMIHSLLLWMIKTLLLRPFSAIGRSKK